MLNIARLTIGLFFAALLIAAESMSANAASQVAHRDTVAAVAPFALKIPDCHESDGTERLDLTGHPCTTAQACTLDEAGIGFSWRADGASTARTARTTKTHIPDTRTPPPRIV